MPQDCGGQIDPVLKTGYDRRVSDSGSRFCGTQFYRHLTLLMPPYKTGITFFTSMYFNMVTSQMGYRFELVARDIDELAERENGAPGSKNNSLMNLYAEHNEACELVDEANTFWEAFVFYAYAGCVSPPSHSCLNVS